MNQDEYEARNSIERSAKTNCSQKRGERSVDLQANYFLGLQGEWHVNMMGTQLRHPLALDSTNDSNVWLLARPHAKQELAAWQHLLAACRRDNVFFGQL